MSKQRVGVGVTVVNRLLYAVGGYDGTNRLRNVECYYPEQNEWKTLSSMNARRSGAGTNSTFCIMYKKYEENSVILYIFSVTLSLVANVFVLFLHNGY